MATVAPRAQAESSAEERERAAVEIQVRFYSWNIEKDISRIAFKVRFGESSRKSRWVKFGALKWILTLVLLMTISAITEAIAKDGSWRAINLHQLNDGMR